MKPGQELVRILDAALSTAKRPLESGDIARIEEVPNETKSPRWWSGLTPVNNMAGGFYGFTAISGKKKLGKTIIGVRASVEAVKGEWPTHYYYGENTEQRIVGMVRRVLGPIPSEALPAYMDRYRYVRFYPGHSIETIVNDVKRTILPSDERVLICIDSINRLARGTGGDYLRALGRICQVCQTAAEESGGNIGFQVLSETNQRGAMVGMDLEYSASCLLYLRPTKNPEAVKMKLESRESEGGELGTLSRNWAECCFQEVKPKGDGELYLVNGEKDPDWAPAQSDLFG